MILSKLFFANGLLNLQTAGITDYNDPFCEVMGRSIVGTCAIYG